MFQKEPFLCMKPSCAVEAAHWAWVRPKNRHTGYVPCMAGTLTSSKTIRTHLQDNQVLSNDACIDRLHATITKCLLILAAAVLEGHVLLVVLPCRLQHTTFLMTGHLDQTYDVSHSAEDSLYKGVHCTRQDQARHGFQSECSICISDLVQSHVLTPSALVLCQL